VQELRVQVLRLIQPLEVLLTILELIEGQALLVVSLLEVGAHVGHDGDFWWNLTLRHPSLGQEGTNVRIVQVSVVIVRVLFAIDEEFGWVVEVVVVGKHSLLDRCDLSGLALDLPLGDLFCG